MAYATVAELAAGLRIRVTTENTDLLQVCLDAAAAEIDHEIDAPEAEWGSADWRFSTATAAADPGAGYLRLNNGNPVNATQVLIDDEWHGKNLGPCSFPQRDSPIKCVSAPSVAVVRCWSMTCENTFSINFGLPAKWCRFGSSTGFLCVNFFS